MKFLQITMCQPSALLGLVRWLCARKQREKESAHLQILHVAPRFQRRAAQFLVVVVAVVSQETERAEEDNLHTD